MKKISFSTNIIITNRNWYFTGLPLLVNKGEFPELAKTGLHSEVRLDITEAITGIPVKVIKCTGRPEAYSTTGFMAKDEDIISVLKKDNATVQKLGLTHPQ